MYEAFYGLSGKPFQLNPDPRFYYSSKPHRRARSYLVYGVMRGEGFIVITGEVGAGKTTVVRDLLESLEDGTVVAAHLVSTQLGAEDALRLVCGAFGVSVRGHSKADLLMALEAFFITQTTQGKRCLLIVDEAQNLQPQAVEELRMLSNFQFGEQALLQTFLIGQPEFRDILQGPGMLQLRQRVTARCHLGPLDAEDTRAYIEHRLKCAGALGSPRFEAAVFADIHLHSGGIPRRINSICDRLLLQGYLSENPYIDSAALHEVLGEIQAENDTPTTTQPSRRQAWSPPAHASAVVDWSAEEFDLANLNLDAGLADSLNEQLGRVSAEQLSARLLRIERSVLRQERISLEILTVLKKITQAGRKAPTPDAARANHHD
ncbi:XrtA/PEP-CTERM system-associated ATPase [Hydrogenophaga sp.]|uniref:XrtA/PEP-CTERM system-associated ATPase n=1 Tax=Hydrogenophaga sp. TaxID=1904254 RepID=UPI00198A4B42|nr:XrtA/PEP-CTERM system-associated ATPase [Hydrogenophaga sp.]MBD3893579.1 ATPase [Hydrogenophaga sp.]